MFLSPGLVHRLQVGRSSLAAAAQPGLEACHQTHENSLLNVRVLTLIMQVALPDGMQEFYLADGMTIGRSHACDICLGQDTQAQRMHARVVVAEGIIRVLGLGSKILAFYRHNVGGKELILTDGVRFRIGSTDCWCVQDSTASSSVRPSPHDVDRHAFKASCPHCHAIVAHSAAAGFFDCDSCGQHILLVDQESDNNRIALLSQFQSINSNVCYVNFPAHCSFRATTKREKP